MGGPLGRKLPPDRDAPHPRRCLSGGLNVRCSHGSRGGSWLESVEGRGEQEKAEGRKVRVPHHEGSWDVVQSQTPDSEVTAGQSKPDLLNKVPRACWEAPRPPGNGQGARGPAGQRGDPQGMGSVLLEPMPGSPHLWGSPKAQGKLGTPPVSWESLTRPGRRKQ